MKKTIVGFDIGNSFLKIATMGKEGIKVESVSIPENLMADGVIKHAHLMSGFLKDVKKEYKIKSGPCGLVVSDAITVCRNVTLPIMTERQLELNLPFEFSDYISDEPEKYVYDYAVQEIVRDEEDNAKEMKLVGAVISKASVLEYIDVFKNAGFKLSTMIPQEVALTNVMSKAIEEERAEADKEYCIINIGHVATRVYIFKGSRLQVIRNVPMGGADIDKAIAVNENVDLYKAATYKTTNYNNVLDKEYCRDVFTKLTLEVMKVVNFYYFNNRESAMDRVYFVGGASRISELCRNIAETTGLYKRSITELLPGEIDEAGAACGLLAIGTMLQ